MLSRKNYLFLSILFILVLFVSVDVSAVSLFNAQSTAKDYLQSGETIDSFIQQTITCDDNSYFVIPVLNSLGDIVFFVPVCFETGEVFIGKNNSEDLKLIKAAYVLKSLSYSGSENYLSKQLIDNISNLKNILNSKKSRLEGVVDSTTYPYDVKETVIVSKNKLNNLISLLTNLEEDLSYLYNKQTDFLYSPTCDKSTSILSNISSSFKDYSKLTEVSLEFISSCEDSTRIVISSEVSDSEKSSLINFVSAPSNLNSEINTIYDSLSSTYSFYNHILVTSTNVTGENNLQLFVDNFKSRLDFVVVNEMLYDFDEDFPEYDNLDSVVSTILNSEYRLYWNNQDDVLSLQKAYSEVNSLYSKNEYSKVVSKTIILKDLAKNILQEGLITTTTTPDYTNYYIILSVFAGLLILILVIFKLKGKKGKKYSSKRIKKENKDILEVGNPFENY